jgi:DnaJ-class molecular chaperone
MGKPCEVCEGARDVFDGERWESCWACDGTGEVAEFYCDSCEDTGVTHNKMPCPECDYWDRDNDTEEP